MAGNSSQKAMNMNSDRISSLPESLLHHIFSISFITTKQAVQMSLLSKQWRHFWKSLPYLRFENLDQFYMTRREEKFITFLRKLVALRDESNLHTFYLKDRDDWCICEEENDELIDLLITLKVQDLHLLRPLYISNSAITRLLNQNHIRSLELEHVNIWDDDGNYELIIPSSSIEKLVLDYCKYERIGSITIHAPKLKYFEIWNTYEWAHDVYNIEIHAPALLQIRLHGNSDCEVDLENTSSLVDVEYDMSGLWYPEDEALMLFRNFLKVLVTAKSFTFDSSQLENYLSEGPSEDLEDFWNPIQASLMNINYLKLRGWHTSLHIHTLAKFIEKFSGLETLVLVGYLNVSEPAKNERDWDKQLAFECRFCKLKSVEIRNIQGHENELIFIAFLLRNAPVLEMLNISINRSLFSRDKLEYSEKLHSLPSFSPSVTISI